jgi:hypothetical protein
MRVEEEEEEKGGHPHCCQVQLENHLSDVVMSQKANQIRSQSLGENKTLRQ